MMVQQTTYDPNIPQNRSNGLATTQPQLLQNFSALFNAFRNNHVALNDDGAGDHTLIQLIEQAQAPQTDPSEINIYCKRDADTTDQMFLRYQGNGQEIQYTCYQTYPLNPVSNGKVVINPYFTFLPGRVIVYFGYFAALGPVGTLNLYPSIAKNIITVSPTVALTSPLVKPTIEIPAKENGFFRSVIFNTSDVRAQLPPLNYIILANV